MPTMRLLLLITGNGVSLPVTELVLLPNLILWLVCQFRQLGDIRRNSPRFVFGEQLGRRSAAGLLLEIDIANAKKIKRARRGFCFWT
jgi:hypothetical protein